MVRYPVFNPTVNCSMLSVGRYRRLDTLAQVFRLRKVISQG